MIGQYYGQTYFGADAKADVTAMVKQILAAIPRTARKQHLAESGYEAKGDAQVSHDASQNGVSGATLFACMIDVAAWMLDDDLLTGNSETERSRRRPFGLNR